MSEELPPCPKCGSVYSYEMGALLICPECAHEWSPESAAAETEEADAPIRDAVGNVLQDGDAVTIAKDLKVKGGGTLKAGTKVKSIRLIDGVDGHDIDCKVDGFGPMQLKSSVVKKA
ncbi:alkylphosphonate utilization protein [Leucobacter coleopterorum]|uniref:Alkylphosphonate utilization protein n=1 Tax=Leucobacter coleopterorum TaxID=2714933 RepID=A0ABX6JZ87_9MICO|nr:zinc ribbon domain-containing protein YjdM [Leucobacter coleopterorum]QIM18080.1 alkylphosphonate utilization protein [Leucobacter coleopterorum]